MRRKQWFCLRCKKVVDIAPSAVTMIGVTGQMMCKECFSTKVFEMTEMEDDEFNTVAKEFKKRTDRK